MHNLIKQHLFYSNKAVLLLIVFYMFIALCCGKRKPPLPPLERVNQKVEINGEQRGNIVFLSWDLPRRNAPDASVLNIDRIDVYRYAEPSNVTLTLTEEDFGSRSTLISTINLSKNDFDKGKLTYTDKLEFAGQPIRLIYAVRVVNPQGQKADFSNFLVIEPRSKVANTPENIGAEITESAVNIKWEAPTLNVDDSTPVNILGYNIYRKIEGEEEFKLLNTSPTTQTNFADETFEFGITYLYFIRTVSLGNDGKVIESLDSKVVQTSPKDIFAPSAPDAITIAAAPNNLSIFFAANPEKDIAGYQIYRSINLNLPLSQWLLLTPEILKTNTFQDKQVESKVTYFYYLIAIDNVGNISKPSNIISETAP